MNPHFVFVTNEAGISSVFGQIKEKLKFAPHSYLSLVYCTTDEHPLFRSELENLERRYPSQLITYYTLPPDPEQKESPGACQKILEMIINSNTSEWMQFKLTGGEDFCVATEDRLRYLGVISNQVQSQII